MMTNDNVLMIVNTIGLFFIGFYAGRRNVRGLAAISAAMIGASLMSIMLNGMHMYLEFPLNISPYEVIFAIICIIFVLGLGYIASRIVLVREKDIGARVKMVEIGKYGNIKDGDKDFKFPDKCANMRSTFIGYALSIRKGGLYDKDTSGEEFNRDMRLHTRNALDNCVCSNKEKCCEDMIIAMGRG